MIKKRFLTILSAMVVLFFYSAAVSAQTPGYALYGDVPYGYTDLTSKVQVVAPATISGQNLSSTDHDTPAAEGIAFTGYGHSSHYCQGKADLSIRFSENQSLTLTDKYAIHIKIKRTTTGSGDIQMSFIRNSWGSVRVGFLMEAAQLSDSESEIVLNYDDRKRNDGQYYCNGENQTYGTRTFNGGNGSEIFRMTAVNGEQFTITQIYIDADATVPDPVKPADDDTEAPTGVSISASNLTHNSVDLTLRATDDKSTIISYAITYNGTTVNTTGTSGEDKVYTLTGLIPSTEYVISVVAKDGSDNAAAAVNLIPNVTTKAEPRGYILYGSIASEDFIDLTGKINTPAGFEGTLVGAGYSNPNICQNNAKEFTAKEGFTMSLTEEFAIHVVIKKHSDANGAVGVSLINGNWNSKRIGWEIANSKISSAAYTDIALKYSERDTKNWNCDGVASFIANDVAYSGQILRLGAANGEQFDIQAIYLEKTYTAPVDNEAPTGLSIVEKSVADNTITVTVSATDAQSPITYIFFNGETEVGTANAASGESVDYTFTGLTANTTYTLGVKAKDLSDNETTKATINLTTISVATKRYYFYRTGDLPANTEDLISVDMRDGAGSTITTNQASKISATTFSKYQLSKSWGFVQVKAKASSLEDVNSDWYLCIRYKSTHPGDVYANVASSNTHQVKIVDKTTENDNLWHAKQIKLDDFTANKTASVFPVVAGSDMFQIQTLDNNATTSGTLTIDYVYLTNSIADGVDAGYVDNAAPVLTVTKKEVAGTSVTLTVKAEDDSDSQIEFTVSNGSDTQNFELADGAEQDVTFSELSKGTDYTFTVDAVDKFGNSATQWSETIKTLGDATAPADLTIVEKSKTYKTITVTVSATDESVPLTFTFYNGEEEVGTASAASGENVDYTFTGLAPETEYTLGVVAKDFADNETEKVTINITTDVAPAAVRYYLVGGENTIDCNITYGNQAYRDERIDDYLSVIAGNNVWNSVTFTPKANVENSLDDDCYIVMRFRSNMSNVSVFGFNNFRVNLKNNAESFYLNSGEYNPCGDNKWHIVKFKLGEAAGEKPAQYLQAGQIALQLHVNANLAKGDYIDIDYIYFTNDISTLDSGVDTHKKVVLKENQNNDLTSANVDVYFDRGFEADGYQYTLCLPFALDEEKAQLYFPGTYNRLESSELHGDLIHLNMVASYTIEAGVPYLYLPNENVAAPMTIEDVTIDSEAETTISTTYFSMTGIYSPSSLPAGAYFLGAEDYLYAVNSADNSKLKAFRAYFIIGENAPAGARARVVFAGQTTTDIENVNENANANKILRDGRIYILRGENVYTINGQLVK